MAVNEQLVYEVSRHQTDTPLLTGVNQEKPCDRWGQDAVKAKNGGDTA